MQVISLSSLIEASDNERGDIEEYLRSFVCEVNENVELFLHNKAIDNELRDFGRTSLVVDEKNNNEIIGFFTITTKPFEFTTASGTTRKRLTGNSKATVFQTILIAQLGRSDNYKGIVTGAEIMQIALSNCNKIYNLSALKVVCVEYDDTEYLQKFYPENGFKELQRNENGLSISYLRL